MPIELENRTKKPLKESVARLLQEAFANQPDVNTLIIVEEFGEGFSDTRVYNIRPIDAQNRSLVNVVVKIGSKSLIIKEVEAYNRHARRRMANATELYFYHVSNSPDDLACVGYELAGAGIFTISTLFKLCTSPQSDLAKAKHIISNKLFHLFSHMWVNPTVKHKVPLSTSYNQILPANIKAKPYQDQDRPFITVTPQTIRLVSLQKELVLCFNGFFVISIDPQKQKLKLSTAPPQKPDDSHLNDQFICQFTNVENIDQYTVGQQVTKLIAEVYETRNSLLFEKAQKYLQLPDKINQDTFDLGFVDPLPNPFAYLEKVLSMPVNMQVANIHGDLNLNNIMLVDGEDIRLIDFAEMRQDAILHDFLRLETGLLLWVLPRIFKEKKLDYRLVAGVLVNTHQRVLRQTEEEDVVQLLPELVEITSILQAIRHRARFYLLDHTRPWGEYLAGLHVYLLGSLRYKNIYESYESTQIAFTAASIVLSQWRDDTNSTQNTLAIVTNTHTESRLDTFQKILIKNEISENECPYKGLAKYEEEDAEWFFGREFYVSKLVEELKRKSILAIVGASGSGKSSLVRAGVIPAIRKTSPSNPNGLVTSNHWHIVVITPQSNPLTRLIHGLVPSDMPQLRTPFRDEIQESPTKVISALIDLYNNGHLLLVVDQFEELLTLCKDESVRQLFIDALVAPVSRLKVIINLRADFYHRFLEYPALHHVFQDNQVIIEPMNDVEIKSVIIQPAQKANLSFEQGLVAKIQRDLNFQPGALPLLSTALRETWERRRKGVMTWQGYEDAGGVQKAIADKAERVYRSFNEGEQNFVKTLFIRLATKSQGVTGEVQTSRQVTLRELSDTELSNKIINKLGKERLITGDQQGLRVAHEALIEHWPRLHEWLSIQQSYTHTFQKLTQRVNEWLDDNKAASHLYQEALLQESAKLLNSNLTLSPDEIEFLTVSHDAQEERLQQEQQAIQNKRRLWFTAGILGVFTILFFIVFGFWRDAETARSDAVVARDLAEIAQQDEVIAKNTAEAARDTAETARDEARAAEEVAENEKKRAEAAELENIILRLAVESKNQRLAVESDTRQDQNFDLALLLAIEAAQNQAQLLSSNLTNNSILLEVDQAIRDALRYQGQPNHLINHHQAAITFIKLSPDKRYLLTATDFEFAIWDTIQFRQIANNSLQSRLTIIAWAPDSQRIAFGTEGESNTAFVWDIDQGLPYYLDSNSHVNHLSWDVEGQRLAVASENRQLNIWRVETDEKIAEINHEHGVDWIAWHPEKPQTALTISDGNVFLWDLSAATPYSPTRQITTNARDMKQALWSNDGKLIMTINNQETPNSHHLLIWDATSGEKLKTFIHPKQINKVVWADNNQAIVSATNSNLVYLWNIDYEEEAILLRGHDTSILDIALSADEEVLISADASGVIRIWDFEQRLPITTLTGHADRVNSIDLNMPENLVFSGSKDLSIRVWDLSENAEVENLTGHEKSIRDISWNQNGTQILTASEDRTARIWDTANGRLLFTLEPHEKTVLFARWSPNGEYIATLDFGGKLYIWDAFTGVLLNIINAHEIEGKHISFNSNYGPNQLVTAGGPTVKLWALSNSELLTSSVIELETNVNDIIWSPDGTKVAILLFSAIEGRAIQIWGIDGQKIAQGNLHTESIETIDWHPDGSQLVTGGEDNLVIWWEYTNNQQIVELGRMSHHTGKVNQVSWHPNGEIVASIGEDHHLHLWHVKSGQILTGTHENSINQLAWHPDGQHIATASNDSTVAIWEIGTLRQLSSLTGLSSFANVLAWSPDGQQIAVGRESGQVIVYYSFIDNLITEACGRSVRNMTEIEWDRFMGGIPYRDTCSPK